MSAKGLVTNNKSYELLKFYLSVFNIHFLIEFMNFNI